jgi:hypothetical protein
MVMKCTAMLTGSGSEQQNRPELQKENIEV